MAIIFAFGPLISQTFTRQIPLGLTGWGFFIAGLALVLPALLARSTWDQAIGTVNSVDNSSEDQTVHFIYQLDGAIFSGTHTETGLKKYGHRLNLLVHPNDRENYLVQTTLIWALGLSLMVVGPLFALNFSEI